MPKRRQSTKRSTALKNGYRSGLEEEVDAELKRVGVDGQYEENKLYYTRKQLTPIGVLNMGSYTAIKMCQIVG